ncbi:hypothetical protein L1987_31065 [Smallanthus sonchifolius]|uniref:Uncharacterized protein n=1 Tax=Smallanthus sonchifolius TaxID=185202 RepID=A0ACB9I5G4_9ASTR|nr:hypothetical protein L1987_31065 [Smallanthus sonchifolius]
MARPQREETHWKMEDKGRTTCYILLRTSHQQPDTNGPGAFGDKPFLRALLRNQRQISPTLEIKLDEDADYDAVQWYDKSVLGKSIDFIQLCCLHKMLNREGLKDMQLRYLGGLYVLITFKKYSEATEMVEGKNKWSDVFSQLEVWTGQEYSYEKIVWLKIFGVPAHLWEGISEESGADEHSSNVQPAMTTHKDTSNGIIIESPADDREVDMPPVEQEQSDKKAQNNPNSPKVADVAQRINTMVWPVSRKRQRIDRMEGDPFDIDRFIGRDTCEQADARNSPTEAQFEPGEFEATIRMGNELGINSDNFEEMVRRVIEGEIEATVNQ